MMDQRELMSAIADAIAEQLVRRGIRIEDGQDLFSAESVGPSAASDAETGGLSLFPDAESGQMADITSREIKSISLLEHPQDPQALERMMRLTTARIGVGSAGPRLKTQTLLALRADHALARDAVMMDVEDGIAERLGLLSLQTCCRDKNEYLTRPDLGRKLSEESVAAVKEQCEMRPDIQLIVADGLSSTAIRANVENVFSMLTEGLRSAGLRLGTPLFVRFGRVGVEDQIAELVGAKAVCMFVGERPGLGSAESMSAYLAYNARVGMAEARRTVVSNIHRDGITAVEAGAYLTDLIQNILERKASGVELRN